MDLTRLYENRFTDEDRAYKVQVWRVLWERTFSRWVRPGDTVVDLGAGFCEFINAARATRRIAVDLNPETQAQAAPGVEVHASSASDLSFLGSGQVDVVFTSNFLEHLRSKDEVTQVVREAHRVLRPGGTLIAMGPNIRLLPGAYWDYFDHHVPLSDRSACELLRLVGFELRHVEPRFLPYTVRSAFVRSVWLVRIYLALRPVSSALAGRQFLIVASKARAGGDAVATSGARR